MTCRYSKKRKNSDCGFNLDNSVTFSKPSLKLTLSALKPIIKKVKFTTNNEKKLPEIEKHVYHKPAVSKKVNTNKRVSSYFTKEPFDIVAEQLKIEPAAPKAEKSKLVHKSEAKPSQVQLGSPYWLQSDQIRDKSGKRSSEEGYDPTTLTIPRAEYLKIPKLHRKYWKFKAKYFDKVVAIRMWSCYFFYGPDAAIIHKFFDTKLNEFKGWAYTYFNECFMMKYAPKLLELGHSIVLVEKMKKNQKKNDDRTKKAVHQVLTRGTVTDSVEIGYSSQFCLCIYEQNLKFGLVYFDTTTHEFFLGEFQDDMYRANLRTVITKIKPVEIVYLKRFITEETLSILKNLPTRPSFGPISFKSDIIPTTSDILAKMMKYFSLKGTFRPALPTLLAEIRNALETKFKPSNEEEKMDMEGRKESSEETGEHEKEKKEKEPEQICAYFFTLKALVLSIAHLENVMLADTIFTMGNFYALDLELEKKSALYMDSQAIENLEILDVGYLSTTYGDYSLFGYMDKTVSPFGKRMFRRWLISPLLDSISIDERLDAVEDLMNNQDVIDYYQNKLKTFPDLERMVNKIYTWTKKKVIALNFEEFAKSRLEDFVSLLASLEKIEPIIQDMSERLSKCHSKRLQQLITVKEVDVKTFEKRQADYKVYTGKSEAMFPKISSLIDDLRNMMQSRSGYLLPAFGLSPQCDTIVTQIDEIKEQLQTTLEEQRSVWGNDSIMYAHTRHRYEIEIPEDLVEKSKKPKGFTITSKKKGIIRYHIPAIEKLLTRMDDLELKLNKLLVEFIIGYFRRFYERKAYWNQVILCLAELDCLCSLASLTNQMKTSCRPKVFPSSEESVFNLRDMVHPCAALDNEAFVANDLIVEEGIDIFLITGSNMGGKSTFLRQSCIAIIMAQMGSFVPARSFELTVVDRIFTRIGASDRLIEGKSTFCIEMEETYHILTEATKDSLLVVDELGRGTSTYDGVSVAYAALKHIAEKIKCRTLFATHYHLLIEEFKLYKNVGTYCMYTEYNEAKEELLL